MADATLELITAVIPTRGRADLVVRAVHSALGQTYPNVEVVVVVDGPDEATVKILQAIGEPRLRVVALTENAGGSEARNIGIREARGSWIALLDDDDEWLPDKLTRQMAARGKVNARHCLVTCQRLERQLGHPDIIAPRRILRPSEDVSEYLFYSDDRKRHTCGPQTSSYLATKDLYLDVPFSKGLKCHQDWDWYLRAMQCGDTAGFMVEEPLYIMYVETTRPRVTDVARWEISLDWVESRKYLFTPRAYNSFLINDCLHRCEETRNRTRIFLKILALCWNSGGLRARDLITAAKWYVFRPSIRMRLIRCYKRMQQSWDGITARNRELDSARTKSEEYP
jgi:glycosyltransferase involved in cell wall biosynthesis